MAYEDFKADTIADQDVKPYVPANWKPAYGFEGFAVGKDTTGFVLEVNSTDTCLVYRHKDGVKYPVTCLLAPSTNLEWKNYEIRGTLVKPVDTVFNHVNVGVVAYSDGKGNEYKLESKRIDQGNTHFYLSGAGISTTIVDDTLQFNAGDTVRFALLVDNADEVYYDSVEAKNITVRDSTVTINAKVWKGIVEKQNWDKSIEDDSEQRIIAGYPGMVINKSSVALPTQGIRAGPIFVRKVTAGGM
jgi:hypothetical protein